MAQTNGTSRKRIAILIEQKVEDAEFQVPYTALRQVGDEIVVLGSRMNEEYKGKQGKLSIKPDGTTTEARAEEFDAVIIPGGMAPDQMRVNPNTVRFVKDAMAQGKLVAAVCHGPQVLIEGDLLRGRAATGYRAIRKDMQNAGANFIDQPLVIDNNLITSRQPSDLPIFTAAILNRLGRGKDLPQLEDMSIDWWRMGEEWGGSSKKEIVDGINIALRGDRYGLEAFEHYEEKASDPELRSIFNEICATKKQHIESLKERLAVFGEKETWQSAGSEALATLKTWLQSSDDMSVLRHAIGDIQTAVVDTYNLYIKYTDPATAKILMAIEMDLVKQEQQLADLYHRWLGKQQAPPVKPTTGAAVTA